MTMKFIYALSSNAEEALTGMIENYDHTDKNTKLIMDTIERLVQNAYSSGWIDGASESIERQYRQ